MPPPVKHEEQVTTQYTANLNFDKNAVLVKPYFLIEVLVKGQAKSFISNKFTANANHISFNGMEIPSNLTLLDIKSKDQVTKLFESEATGERYYPWVSVIEIVSKRFV